MLKKSKINSGKKWTNTRKSERSGILDKQINLRQARLFAERIAKEAGQLLTEYADKIKILNYKDRQDVTTNADLASEKLIIQAIEEKYPEHNILSEEKGKVEKGSPLAWIIDPLDGTKEYVRGIPIYNVALTLCWGEETLLAVVFSPAEKQLFTAVKGEGSFLNGRSVKVSLENDLADSFVFVYLPRFEGDEREFNLAWQKLAKISRKVYRLRSLSKLNVLCCWVAMGGCEAFLNLINSPEIWDILPGLFIARQAGAKISDLSGKPILGKLGKGFLVSNGLIHKSLLEVMNES